MTKKKIGNLEFAIILVVVAGLMMLAIPTLKKSSESKARASCANNLKQLGVALRMYANESRGEKYPSLSPIRDNWIMDIHAIYPEYLTDLATLIDPASPFATEYTFRSSRSEWLDPDCVSGLFYNYSGYFLKGETQALALLFAYESMELETFRGMDHNLNVPVWEQEFEQSGNALIWDRVPLIDSEFSHRAPLGGNVLLFDGHVEFVRYSPYNNPSYFPMTRVGAELFNSVQPKLPSHCF